jgi:hypothetical protein
METSFGLLFYLKKSKFFREEGTDIYMRITIDGHSAEISTKRKCKPDNWNVEAGRLKGKSDSVKTFNAYLDTLQQKVFEAKRNLIEMDKELTAESIKNLLLGKDNRKKHMLLEVFQNHNEQMEALVGQEYAPGTLERYKTSFKHTKSYLKWKYQYLKWKYQIEDIDITKLNFEFISDYEFWLKSVRKCDHNTTMKYLSNFKKIVIKCIKNGWLQKDPFIGFNMAKREVERTALTENELEIIQSKSFSIKRLKLLRNIFLFSCYTGLAYADVQKLKRSEIMIGVDGEKWIFTKR